MTTQAKPELSRRRWLRVLALASLALALLLPRTLGLDRYATVDEPTWLMRSANFYNALGQRDFAATFQSGHPGVTATWAGTAAFLLRYPQYRGLGEGEYDSALKFDRMMEARGVAQIEILAAARSFMALANAAALLLAFWPAARLLRFWPAWAGFLLLAFDPFHIGLSRLLHLDGLLSSFCLLSVLALLAYLFDGRRRVFLALSGAAFGLAWLTKLPGVLLGPFAGLAVLLAAAQEWREWPSEWGERLARLAARAALPLGAWASVGLLALALLWPVMWVQAGDTLARQFGLGLLRATEVKVLPGEQAPAVGFAHGLWLYLDGYFSESTPAALFGLALAVWAYASRLGPLGESKARRTAEGLILFAVLFIGAMSAGTVLSVRYAAPAYLSLTLIAALGWLGLASRLGRVRFAAVRRWAPCAILAAALLWQAAESLATHPYYLSHYNSLLGGGARLHKTMNVGWGEGLDEAARYLNRKPDAESLRAMSWYGIGPFSYFFEGQTDLLRISRRWPAWETEALRQADYLVIYVHQWTRRKPERLLEALEGVQPEHSVWIDGIEYARIYRVEALPPQAFEPDER